MGIGNSGISVWMIFLWLLGAGLIVAAMLYKHKQINQPVPVPQPNDLSFKQIVDLLSKMTPGAREKFITLLMAMLPDNEKLWFHNRLSKEAWRIQTEQVKTKKYEDRGGKRAEQNYSFTAGDPNVKE